MTDNYTKNYPRGIFMRDDGVAYDSVSHAARLIASEIGIKVTTARSRLSRAAGTGRTVYGHTWTFEDCDGKQMNNMRQCFHDASYQSTLRINKITSVITQRSRFSCECTVCKRMTDWYWTRYEAQVEAWYECWMDEYV